MKVRKKCNWLLRQLITVFIHVWFVLRRAGISCGLFVNVCVVCVCVCVGDVCVCVSVTEGDFGAHSRVTACRQ